MTLFTVAHAKRKRKQPERTLQRQVVDFLNSAKPIDAFVSAIPGGDRQMTLTPGYVAGLHDLLFLWSGMAFLIELKAPNGRVSHAQIECHRAVTAAGGISFIARSLKEVESFLRSRGVPLRGRVV